MLATESRFTLGDTKIFWKAVETIIERAVLAEQTLNIAGFGKLYIVEVKAGKGWDGINKVFFDRAPYKKVVFKLSTRYKKMLDEQNEIIVT